MTGDYDTAPGIPQGAPRTVVAIACFRGEPGRDSDAARAWAFELTYGFGRGVGEPPAVTYCAGIYTVTGIIQTTYNADTATTVFSSHEDPWDLDFCLNPERQARVSAAHAGRRRRGDGRSSPMHQHAARTQPGEDARLIRGM